MFFRMDQVKGVLTLQGEALTQAVSASLHVGLFCGIEICRRDVVVRVCLNKEVFVLFCLQDINIKVAKSSQVMHFAFRDDKQWKLQQV